MVDEKRKGTWKKCEECGVRFKALRADARFHSERCRTRAHRQRTLTIPGMEITMDPEFQTRPRTKKKKKGKKSA